MVIKLQAKSFIRVLPAQTDRQRTEKGKLPIVHQTSVNSNFTMRFNVLFVLLILSCLCLALAQVSYDDCCLKYVKKMNRNTQRHAVAYRHQKTDGGCNIPAVIFTMRKGRMFCTNPREEWVKELMQKIDEREHKYKKYNPQHSHKN